jgi:hypothetical protein
MTCSFQYSYPVATCSWCDKGTYTTRKSAKRASRRHHPGRVFNAYRCPIAPMLWHYGTLPPGGRQQARRSQDAKLSASRFS